MYKAELYYDGGFLRESDGYEFETYDEAIEALDEWREDYITIWKLDDAWGEDDDENYFSAEISEAETWEE